jgi:hypothetical protein
MQSSSYGNLYFTIALHPYSMTYGRTDGHLSTCTTSIMDTLPTIMLFCHTDSLLHILLASMTASL